LVVLVLAVTGLAGCSKPKPPKENTKVTVRFTWKNKGEYAPLYLALDKGYYKAEGLDVTFAEGSGAQTALKLLANGQDQVVYGPAVAGAQAVSTDLPIKMIALYTPKVPMGVISFPEVKLSSPKDLEGKKIATSVGETFTDLLPSFAKINKVDLNKITRVQMDNSARTAQFLNKKVDIMSVYLNNELPELEKTAGVKFNVLNVADWGMDLPGAAFISSNDYIAKNPKVLEGLLRATAKGFNDAQKNPEEAATAMLKYWQTTVDKAIVTKQVKATVDALGVYPAKPLGYQDADLWTKALNLMMDTGAIKVKKDAAAYYTNDLLK
jgi:NitT/TauT family transport system substrate-binding protein